MSQAKRYMELAALTGNRPLDCAYHAAFYLLSQEPELFETARKCVTVIGIDFAKIKRLTKGFDETSQQIIDLAHNLFSYTSKCKVTPFDISRLGYPYMEQVCNAIFIASGEVQVQIQAAENGEPEMLLDDSPYQRTQRVHRQINQMWAEKLAGQDETEDMER